MAEEKLARLGHTRPGHLNRDRTTLSVSTVLADVREFHHHVSARRPCRTEVIDQPLIQIGLKGCYVQILGQPR